VLRCTCRPRLSSRGFPVPRYFLCLYGARSSMSAPSYRLANSRAALTERRANFVSPPSRRGRSPPQGRRRSEAYPPSSPRRFAQPPKWAALERGTARRTKAGRGEGWDARRREGRLALLARVPARWYRDSPAKWRP
jgi:hypothetical protein